MKIVTNPSTKPSPESAKTSEFTKKALEFMLRKPTDLTRPYYEIIKLGLGRAIDEFYVNYGYCPLSIEISEIRAGALDNQLVITILVHGNKDDKSTCTYKRICRWLGVRFDTDSFDRICGQEDARVYIVNAHKYFNATGDLLFSYSYSM